MNSNNKITIYGGGKEIGGSAILIKNISEEKSILMDFGYNFHVANNFLDEFLQPRDHRKLLDHISLGLLPIPKGDLKGIYRRDLYMHYKCTEYLNNFTFACSFGSFWSN